MNAVEANTPSPIDSRARSRSDLNVGSLLRLFKSAFFDAWLAITYIHRYINNQGVTDYLCNELYRLPDEDIDFYATELCVLAVSYCGDQRQQSAVERFILDKCAKSLRLTIKVCWIFQAFIEDNNPKLFELAVRLREFAEIAAINCKRPSLTRVHTRAQSMNDLPAHGEGEVDFEFELSKKDRADYFSSIMNFVEQLWEIAKKLKALPPEARQERLQEEIRLLNESMPLGLYLPLWHGSRFYHCILRFPPSEARVLNSRERVPYMLSLELLESTEEVTSSNIHKIVSSYAPVIQGARSPSPQNRPPNFVGGESSPPTSSSSSPLLATTTTTATATPPPSSPPLASSASLSSSISTSTYDVTTTTTTTPPSSTTPTTVHTPPPSVTSSPSVRVPTLRDSLREPAYLRDSGVLPTTTTTTLNTPPSPSPNANGQADANTTASGPLESSSGSPPPPSRSPRKAPAAFGKLFSERAAEIQASSPYGKIPSWKLASIIVKFGDDCRQEQLAMQLLMQFHRIWVEAGLPLYLRPYEILITSANSGLIETVPDTMSLHNLKKNTPGFTTLASYFSDTYGAPQSDTFKSAQKNFVESMAAYSLVCYFMQIKDRHNGNILIDTEGHIIHIDFGFMLSNSPGGMYFESAPFKLTQELVDVMGGISGSAFLYFKALCIRGFLEARKHMEKIVSLVEVMMLGSPLPCFVSGPPLVEELRARFAQSLPEPECVAFVEALITDSLDHFKTRYYDKYQSWTNGILA